MDRSKLRRIAAREVTAGLRKSSSLMAEVKEEMGHARFLPSGERTVALIRAQQKKARASRMLKIAARIADAHGLNGNGRSGNSGRNLITGNPWSPIIIHKRRIADAS